MDGVQSHDEYLSQQWVDVQHQHHHQLQQHQQHQQHQQQQQHQQHQHLPGDYSAHYAYVDSPGYAPPDSSFRLQPPTISATPNWLPQWGQQLQQQQQTMPLPAPQTAPQYSQQNIAPAPPPQLAAAASITSAPAQSTSSPRRTLTDADRRKMCIFHEENPNVKQTEIGAMFGVERSTVSKVLRQKEKYLFPDDGSRSPVKRSKGKFPDIERALSVWAKNTRKQGITLTDVMIREKARFFATSLGISDSHFKANSASWLEKFKHKNNVHPGGRGRSESDATGIGRTVMRQSHTRTESINCDDSGSPMMMQHSKSQDSDSPNSHTLPPHHHQASDSPDSLSFSAEFSGGYKAFQHQNSGSLDPFAYPPETEKVVLGPASPASPFFSPHDHPSPGFPSVHARMAPGTYQRPRSQTFPLLPIDGTYISPPPSSEPLTPGAAAASAASPAGGSPPPPSKDEAKQALEVVITFLRRQPAGFVEQDEYVMVGKLREKFGLSAGQMDAEAADTIMGFSNNPP